LASKTGTIKMRNLGNTALCGEQIAPDLFCSVPNRADQADASDYDATSQLLPAFRVLTDVVDGILHSTNLLRIFVGDFDLISLFAYLRMLLGVVESVLHCAEFLSIFFRNLHAEGFFQCHDELNLIK